MLSVYACLIVGVCVFAYVLFEKKKLLNNFFPVFPSGCHFYICLIRQICHIYLNTCNVVKRTTIFNSSPIPPSCFNLKWLQRFVWRNNFKQADDIRRHWCLLTHEGLGRRKEAGLNLLLRLFLFLLPSLSLTPPLHLTHSSFSLLSSFPLLSLSLLTLSVSSYSFFYPSISLHLLLQWRQND